MGTYIEWSDVARLVAAITVGSASLEILVELIGVKNNPRASLVLLRNLIFLTLLFSMISEFGIRLLHGTMLLITIGVVLVIVISGIVNRRFSRLSKAP